MNLFSVFLLPVPCLLKPRCRTHLDGKARDSLEGACHMLRLHKVDKIKDIGTCLRKTSLTASILHMLQRKEKNKFRPQLSRSSKNAGGLLCGMAPVKLERRRYPYPVGLDV